MLMRKPEFCQEMKKRKGVSYKDASFIYDVFCDTLTEVLAEDNDVVLLNVGVLYIKNKPAYSSHNPRTQEKIKVPPRKLLRFREATAIKDFLAGKRDTYNRRGLGGLNAKKRRILFRRRRKRNLTSKSKSFLNKKFLTLISKSMLGYVCILAYCINERNI